MTYGELAVTLTITGILGSLGTCGFMHYLENKEEAAVVQPVEPRKLASPVGTAGGDQCFVTTVPLHPGSTFSPRKGYRVAGVGLAMSDLYGTSHTTAIVVFCRVTSPVAAPMPVAPPVASEHTNNTLLMPLSL